MCNIGALNHRTLARKNKRAYSYPTMGYKVELVAPPQIAQAILLIRGQRVMLDRDLAAMYGVTTGNLNKAARRNLSRFPADFMFQLTAEEADSLRVQFGISQKGLHFKYLPKSAAREFPGSAHVLRAGSGVAPEPSSAVGATSL